MVLFNPLRPSPFGFDLNGSRRRTATRRASLFGMARHGKAWQGMARHGKAWQSMARHGKAWHGKAWQGMARQGMARHDMARHDMARHGKAWQGEASLRRSRCRRCWERGDAGPSSMREGGPPHLRVVFQTGNGRGASISSTLHQAIYRRDLLSLFM